MQIRGALHLHSAYSYDAKLILSELKEFFMNEGLSFALMTEHTDEIKKADAERFIAECRSLSDESFVFVPGFEVPYKNTHVLMIGANSFFEEQEAEALRKFKSCSARAVLAHPHKHGFWVDDTLKEVIDGIEIWNSQYDGKYTPRTKSLKLYKQFRHSQSFHAFAGWDFHRVEHTGGPTLNCDVHRLSESDILSVLAGGRFTIEGRGSTMASDGSFLYGGGFVSVILGHVTTSLVAFGKRVNALLAYFGIRLPRVLRRLIRRIL